MLFSVDAIDMSGKHEVDLHTNIWKRASHDLFGDDPEDPDYEEELVGFEGEGKSYPILDHFRYGHIIGTDYLSDQVEKEHGAHHDREHGHEHHDEQKTQEHTFNEDAEKMVECQKHWRMVKGLWDVKCADGRW
ncbi:hypothetical protein ACP4OV_007416 [Aristida adscensionis]